MQLEQFHFVLEDIKSQLATIPPLQSLLKLTQKTTKKLECLNLYSQADKRQFDMQIQQQNIFKQITELYKHITTTASNYNNTTQQITTIKQSIDEIRQKYCITFDSLNRQQEILNMQFASVDKMLMESQATGSMMIKQAKEIDQYQHEDQEGDGIGGDGNKFYDDDGNDYNDGMLIDPAAVRIQKLKTQIQTILKKISLLNNGKGKWFDTDHKDFIKIYNKCQGNDKKIIHQGTKLLGMNQTQIMDHLELYQNYLQLEKQKKLVSEQYRQIKLLEQEDNREKQQHKQQIKKLQEKLRKEKQLEQRLKKKDEIEKYKQKKLQQKERMFAKQEEEKQKPFKIPPLQPQKKKDIMERNRLMLENQQKKIIEMKNKRQSMEKGKSYQQHQSIDGKKNQLQQQSIDKTKINKQSIEGKNKILSIGESKKVGVNSANRSANKIPPLQAEKKKEK